MATTKSRIDEINRTLAAQARFMGSKTIEKYGLELLKLESDYDGASQANQRYTDILTGTSPEVAKAAENTNEYIEKLSDEYIQLTLTGRALLEYKAIKAGANAETLDGVIALQLEIQAIKDRQEALKNTAKLEKEIAANEERLHAKFDKIDEQDAKNDEKTKSDELKREEDLFREIQLLNDRKIAEEQRLQAAKDAIQDYSLASASNVVGQLSAIAKEGSKEAKALFLVQQAIAVATTLVNTERAAIAAGAVDAQIGGLFGFLASSTAIRAMGYASAGIIAGTAIAGGRALGGQVRGGESYLVGERGPELLTMGTSGRIATNENLKRAVNAETVSGDRSVNVNFTIQANDTTGFDRLLNSRRGQIISMVNQAVNDRGRASIV